MDDLYVPETGPLDLYFPLPYRVSFLILLGVWAWGANLQTLRDLSIDVPALIRYPGRPSLTVSPHYLSTYRLATILCVPFVISILLFWSITRGNLKDVIVWQGLPVSYLLFLLLCFCVPISSFSRNGRFRFLTTLRRVSIGGIAEAADGKFGDVLVADVLTSYAKVFGDVFVVICMLITPGRSATGRPDRTCGSGLGVPLLISVPFLIRFRQCLIEYSRVRNSVRKTGYSASTGWGGQHLANALKYATAFPVTLFSALQRNYNPQTAYVSQSSLYTLWLLSVMVNSLYSFYWDVAKDWDLTLFSSPKERNNPNHPYGLRQDLYFHTPSLYYTVIAMDLILRCTWSLKLSPHLNHFNDMEAGIFAIEIMEIFRRWVWVFFRVEAEWVRSTQQPVADDLLLGEYASESDYED